MSVNVDERFAPPWAHGEDAAPDEGILSRRCLHDSIADTRVIKP